MWHVLHVSLYRLSLDLGVKLEKINFMVVSLILVAHVTCKPLPSKYGSVEVKLEKINFMVVSPTLVARVTCKPLPSKYGSRG